MTLTLTLRRAYCIPEAINGPVVGFGKRSGLILCDRRPDNRNRELRGRNTALADASSWRTSYPRVNFTSRA